MKKTRACLALILILAALDAAASGRAGYFLAELTARWDCTWDMVRVRWETVDETDTIGFHVWRSRERDGVYSRLTDDLWPARAGDFRGARYLFEDENVFRYHTYYYQIEERRFGGVDIFHEPERARDYCDDDDDDPAFIATCFIRGLW